MTSEPCKTHVSRGSIKINQYWFITCRQPWSLLCCWVSRQLLLHLYVNIYIYIYIGNNSIIVQRILHIWYDSTWFTSMQIVKSPGLIKHVQRFSAKNRATADFSVPAVLPTCRSPDLSWTPCKLLHVSRAVSRWTDILYGGLRRLLLFLLRKKVWSQ